jgi:hypothetical protein
MLIKLGEPDYNPGLFMEARAIFDKAKAVLVKYGKSRHYGHVLGLTTRSSSNGAKPSRMKGRRWSVPAIFSDPAFALNNLGVSLSQLKQCEEAIPLFEEAVPIFQRVCGDQHPISVRVRTYLAGAHRCATHPQRGQIKASEYRMCNQCGKVLQHMSECSGCARVWYCDTDCQLLHWLKHKPLQCDAVLTVNRYCSRCNNATSCCTG